MQIRPGGEPRAVGAKDDKMLRLQLEVLLLHYHHFTLVFHSWCAPVVSSLLSQAVENENREVSGDDTDEDGDGTGVSSPSL